MLGPGCDYMLDAGDHCDKPEFPLAVGCCLMGFECAPVGPPGENQVRQERETCCLAARIVLVTMGAAVVLVGCRTPSPVAHSTLLRAQTHFRVPMRWTNSGVHAWCVVGYHCLCLFLASATATGLQHRSAHNQGPLHVQWQPRTHPSFEMN